jgi:predicted TIM-barrel fold metal-dependent hydrolase
LDDKFFWPILERAQSLQVPIYLHPTPPPESVIKACYSGFSPEVTFMFASLGWDWHIETAILVLRMILGGAFDRYPKLQLIIGHMGEWLPFMQSRVDIMAPAITGLKRPISAYLRENVHYTVQRLQLHFDFPRSVASGRRGSDYVLGGLPVRIDGASASFFGQLPVMVDGRERIAHGNAERLLGLLP